MRLSEAEKKYRNQWIVFKYSDKERSLGRVVCHSKDRDQLYQKLRERRKRGKKLSGEYITYTGKSLIPKGWGVLLCLR